MTQYVTVSFSGGKDSTAMLLHMMELGEHIDEVINVDTGMEFPAMYEHIARVRRIVEDAGIKYTELRAPFPSVIAIWGTPRVPVIKIMEQ